MSESNRLLRQTERISANNNILMSGQHWTGVRGSKSDDAWRRDHQFDNDPANLCFEGAKYRILLPDSNIPCIYELTDEGWEVMACMEYMCTSDFRVYINAFRTFYVYLYLDTETGDWYYENFRVSETTYLDLAEA